MLHPVHTVHQFHAGSAMGDAITNAMLMIRSMLRAMGYASEIFAEHIGEGLAGELHTIDALPRHDRYVLLAHHSIGHPGFDRIIALPARKIIVYHNITPPELLTLTPYGSYARTGREQLAAWRAHAVASLADSEYNAIELRTLGFSAVRSCTLLFDLAALRQQAAAARIPPHESPFTILLVGRITPPKAQDDLLSAYAAFCARFAKPSRLVLVGAFDPDQSAYLDRLYGMLLEL